MDIWAVGIHCIRADSFFKIDLNLSIILDGAISQNTVSAELLELVT